MDDEIIYSWCFNDVECFDSTPSAAIIILDKDLESFSSLRSQQRIDGNGRDGGVEKKRYSSNLFSFFYFSLFLSFSPSFFLAFFFSFFSFVLLL